MQIVFSRPLVVAAGLGLVVGAISSWFATRPPEPWMEFIPDSVGADYALGDTEIHVAGRYEVNRECSRPVIWRIEAIATDGQIALYGPRPPPPDFSLGQHELTRSIPLEQEILPDGWTVSATTTCPGEKPETVPSQIALVRILPEAIDR